MNATNKKILIVDDDPDIALALATMLEDEGFAVVATDDGDSLAHVHEHELPSLILLDMLLSGWDGREITRQLKRRQATQHIPILMLSAHPTAECEARAAGADDFLAKPFELDDLLAKVALHTK